MRDALAERLLATVMKWGAADVARERPDLQALAAYKYDEYQQYSPGMRFVESLSLWLDQFVDDQDRVTAYAFVRERLVFISDAEVAHFVGAAYPDYIRPFLVRRAANRLGVPDSRVARILHSEAFRILRRQTLFLGLSDGAHTDLFRRSNSAEITHEQVWATYEIPSAKATELRVTLGSDLRKLFGRPESSEERRFKIICLLDDFSGSGLSYLWTEDGGQTYTGKIHKVLQSIDGGTLRQLVDPSDLHICILLYVATEEARSNIERLAAELAGAGPVRFTVVVVQLLPDTLRLRRDSADSFAGLLERYYDPALMDEHLAKGGEDVIYGFREGGLPVVLGHNTPNNSVYLLWGESSKVHPLFPRVSRHRREE